MFSTFGFLAQQILGVVGIQIETKWIFSLAGILINFKRCHLQTKNIKKLIFVNKKFNDPKIRCIFPSNFVEFLEKDIDLKEELEEFEREFEKDEIVDV
jgi:hypothetical protein